MIKAKKSVQISLLLGVLAAISQVPFVYADSATISIDPLHGQVVPAGDLELTGAQFFLGCFYGTLGSSAGPEVTQDIETSARQNGSNKGLTFQTESATLRTWKPLNRLNGCGIYAYVTGLDHAAGGKKVEGTLQLLYSEGWQEHPFWENEHLTQDLQDRLDSKPIRVEVEPPAFGLEQKIRLVNWTW